MTFSPSFYFYFLLAALVSERSDQRLLSVMQRNAVGNKPHLRPRAHGRAAHGDRPSRLGQPPSRARGHTGGRPKGPVVVEDGTIPAALISPFQASQPQAGQHSATVVRTSVSGPSQQQMLFYSSVQRRGGVFTKSEYETKAQLARTGVLPNSIAYRKRARAALEEKNGNPRRCRAVLPACSWRRRSKMYGRPKRLWKAKRRMRIALPRTTARAVSRNKSIFFLNL
ncbi:hypothetical protein TRSC58_04362 [Trypanosoma rangeli SC58]|uniref:Uncharacterized protein n=1 Tax=Trypanosoma rangeli SC58 TaxID=429131 RepID=A0A061IZ34_TRYRA|nr:hypothetical protein TRSC58_04362 [Trypanosoma rangeli SC58]